MNNCIPTIDDINTFAEVNIDDETMKDLIRTIFEMYKEKIEVATAGENHHNYTGGLLHHSYSVARLCLKIIEDYNDVEINKDLLLTAALLHDIGKIYENDSTLGAFAKHNTLSSLMIQPILVKYNLPKQTELALHNMILTHMQSFYDEDSKVAEVATLESVILRAADTIDAFIAGSGKLLNQTSRGCYYSPGCSPRDLYKP